MVLVKGNLGGDDITILLEVLFEVLGLFSLGNLAHEQVLCVQTSDVGTEQFRVVGKGTAGLVFKGEEAQFGRDFVELLGIVNLDNSGVEGLAGVTANLGHVLKIVAGLLLDHLSELGGGV